MTQKTIDDQIKESKAAEAKTGRPGRPKGEPTRMTSVNLPTEYHLPAPEMVQRITAWLDRIDLDELVKAAARLTMDRAVNQVGYRTVKFHVDDVAIKHAMIGSQKENPMQEMHKERVKQYRKGFRLTVALSDRIDHAAKYLNTKRSDIIRLAMIDAYPKGGDSVSFQSPAFPHSKLDHLRKRVFEEKE